MMHWAAKYIGHPYKEGGRGTDGVDCWGLLCLVYHQEFHIELPEIPGITATAVLAFHSALEKEVLCDWEESDWPFDGCAVAMSQKEAIHHVGLWADADGGKIIHSWKQQKVIADTPRLLALKGIKTVRYYRHSLWTQRQEVA